MTSRRSSGRAERRRVTCGDPAPNFLIKVSYKTLNFPRPTRIICDGTVYIKQARPADDVS